MKNIIKNDFVMMRLKLIYVFENKKKVYVSF